MSFRFEHVHMKSNDPSGTAKFYREALGATLIEHVAETDSWRLDLKGVKLTISGIVRDQDRKQLLGIEHIALETNAFDDDVKRLTDGGAMVLLVQPNRTKPDLRVGFLETPDGLHQIELIEARL